MLALPAAAALWFLPAAVPVALWVAWSDMAAMRIPNAAVMALAAAYAGLGLAALPPAVWAWGWAQGALVLVLGFGLNLARLVGAGDAKFAAAMALFVAPADAGPFLVLFMLVALSAVVTHRAVRALPPLRALTPAWESWRRRDFPMGLPLGGALAIYLGLAAVGV